MPTRYHVAIRRPDDDAILVLADGAMPGFSLDGAPPWQVVTPVVDRMLEEHGLRVVALRAAWLSETTLGSEAADRLYETTHVGGRVPSGARWVGIDDLERRPTPLGRAIDGGALQPADGDRQPWYLPGWFAEMSDWIDARLDHAGLQRHGPIRQVRSWGRSALLTLETGRGRLWAKQVPSVFAHEVAVTGMLEDVDPGIVPPLVAAQPAQGRLLMEHVDGPILGSLAGPTEAWMATMARLAEIQRVMAVDLRALEMAGVPRASLRTLGERVPMMLADDRLTLAGRPGGLASADRTTLEAAAPDVVNACMALASSSIGPSLEHGDLSPNQVIMGEMGPVFLDWSDASITHPFLAAASFLLDPEGRTADMAARLEGAYLDGWAGTGLGEDGPNALALARIVHPLHMAQLYADRILPGLEQRWEMERMVPDLLRTLLPRLATLPRILAS